MGNKSSKKSPIDAAVGDCFAVLACRHLYERGLDGYAYSSILSSGNEVRRNGAIVGGTLFVTLPNGVVMPYVKWGRESPVYLIPLPSARVRIPVNNSIVECNASLVLYAKESQGTSPNVDDVHVVGCRVTSYRFDGAAVSDSSSISEDFSRTWGVQPENAAEVGGSIVDIPLVVYNHYHNSEGLSVFSFVIGYSKSGQRILVDEVMLDLKDPPSSMSLISARASARTNGKYMIDVCVSPFYSNMLAQQELIVFEDNQLIIVDKPIGVLTQSDITCDDDLLSAVKLHIKHEGMKPGDAYVGLVHRLDRPCSGLVVLAKTSKAAARLSEAFRERRVVKKYMCVVEGALVGKGECSDLMQKSRSHANKSTVSADAGVEASLSFCSENVFSIHGKTLSLVSVNLSTGRKHQIRAQLSHMGHPIVGDVKYGAVARFPSKIFPSKGLALHSCILSFHHPVSAQQVIAASLPSVTWTDAFGQHVHDHTRALVDSYVKSCRHFHPKLYGLS